MLASNDRETCRQRDEALWSSERHVRRSPSPTPDGRRSRRETATQRRRGRSSSPALAIRQRSDERQRPRLTSGGWVDTVASPCKTRVTTSTETRVATERNPSELEQRHSHKSDYSDATPENEETPSPDFSSSDDDVPLASAKKRKRSQSSPEIIETSSEEEQQEEEYQEAEDQEKEQYPRYPSKGQKQCPYRMQDLADDQEKLERATATKQKSKTTAPYMRGITATGKTATTHARVKTGKQVNKEEKRIAQEGYESFSDTQHHGRHHYSFAQPTTWEERQETINMDEENQPLGPVFDKLSKETAATPKRNTHGNRRPTRGTRARGPNKSHAATRGKGHNPQNEHIYLINKETIRTTTEHTQLICLCVDRYQT